MLISKLNITSPDLNVMLKACLKASRAITRDFGEIEHLHISQKSIKNFTANTDNKTENIIKNILSEARPDHGFLLEESGEIKGQNEFRWIVDPLDGSNNFANAIPHFAISIALEYRSEIISGMIYNPINNDLFYAEKNCGAFHNDKRIRPSAKNTNSQSIISTTFPHAPSLEENSEFYTTLQRIQQNHSIRANGAVALDLCAVAKGMYSGYYAIDVNYWDVAAGSIIINESGGKISTLSNNNQWVKNRGCIAGSTYTHQSILEMTS